MRRLFVMAGLVAGVAACERPPAPVLDVAHLPAELRGLLPGAATERELSAAFPDAVAVRDRQFGGEREVLLTGEPAMQVQSAEAGVEAWLVRQDGEVRIMSMFARTRRSCRDVAHDLAGDVQPGTCGSRERMKGEHAYCASTAGRRFTIDVSCFDRPKGQHWGWIAVHVGFAPAQERSYLIGPLDAGAT